MNFVMYNYTVQVNLLQECHKSAIESKLFIKSVRGLDLVQCLPSEYTNNCTLSLLIVCGETAGL